jgi:hypothetical protein
MSKVGLVEMKPYISDEDLATLITKEIIRETVPAAPDSLIDYINHNKKLFAITMRVMNDGEDLLEAMYGFKRYNFSDQSLKVQDVTAEGMCAKHSGTPESSDEESESESGHSEDMQSKGLRCRHPPEVDFFHKLPWSHDKVQDFYKWQWSFLVPKFRQKEFSFNFLDDEILPFRDVGETHWGQGHFSVVSKATMLAKHQDVIITVGRTYSRPK